MIPDSKRPGRRAFAHNGRRWLLASVIASVGGCGPATDEQRELPPEAKQALAKKKVDVQPRASKKATTGR